MEPHGANILTDRHTGKGGKDAMKVNGRKAGHRGQGVEG